MTTTIFPSLAGVNFPVVRTQEWANNVEFSRSGKPARVQYWSAPRWRWELGFDFLRLTTAYPEFQKLAGFFGSMAGSYGTFLYTDANDYTVTAQSISTVGSTASTSFQLIRTFGVTGYEFSEPIYAPSTTDAYTVFVGGSSVTSTFATISGYDTTSPGTINFTSPPGAVAIAASFNYSFPCMFEDDKMDFRKFMATLYDNDRINFMSIK